jgi:ATP-binding cassette subfamily B protein
MDQIQSKQKSGFGRLIEIAGSKRWWLFASMALAVIAAAAKFIPTVIVYFILRELAAHAANISALDKELLFRLGYISLASVGAYGVILYSSSMLSHIAAFNILYEIRVKIAEKLTRLSMGFFTKRTSGEIKKVLTEDVERIELFVAHYIPDITTAVVFPLVVIAFLFVMDWRLAIAALIPFPVAMGVLLPVMMMGEKTKQSYREYHNALERMNAAVVEYVRGMPVVKVFGRALESFKRLKDSVMAFRDFSISVTRTYSKLYPAFLTAASSSLVFIVPAAVVLLRTTGAGESFIPMVLLFLVVGGGFFFPLLKLMFMFGNLNQISIGTERIDRVLYTDEIPEEDSCKRPADMSLEFENVSFAYDETVVLKDVSFKAEPNTVTALVGPSGAGKTTMGLLAARFWDIVEGSIKIGGVDIREMGTAKLMDYVSFVFQDGFLFFDTIEENIRMGNSEASMEEVIAAAKAAQCHEFIRDLPNGYATLVGEGGTYLSGGEQQRIGIARAILKNTPIVILDEATAYADPENEGKILDALSHLIEAKTVIVIAHRLSTISSADNIIVVDEGRIEERGTHDGLVMKGGLYASMWDTYSRARDWQIELKGDGNA